MNKWNVDSLSLEEKIGQLIMFGFDATEPNDHAIELIKEHKIGNVILFARNVSSPRQLFHLNQNLQKLAMSTIGIPLFISIDQEGGMVTRIYQKATHFPGAMTIAATNQPKIAYEVGQKMGDMLDALGINMNLSPVLDINNNPKNPVIGVRSYGDLPEEVATYGTLMMKGLQTSIFATGKHFPGHGDTHTDSHLSLPRVNHSLEQLKAVELVPFKKAIDEGIACIMSSHIDFPLLTQGFPCTLSKTVLTDLLREELGFKGLIISDCMQMKGIQNHYTTPEAVLMGIKAGIDIVCISHSKELQFASYQRLLKAVQDNELEMSLLNERVKHILNHKKKMRAPDFSMIYDTVKSRVENKSVQAFALDVVRKAATLVKGNPIKLSDHALLIGIMPVATTIADESGTPISIDYMLKKAFPKLTVRMINVDPNQALIEETVEAAHAFDQIIVTSYNSNVYIAQSTLIRALETLGKDIHVIALRNPYDLYMNPSIKNYVALYECTPNAMQVLIEYLNGSLTCTGRMPVNHG